MYEDDISAEEAATYEGTWFPKKNENKKWPKHPERQESQRQEEFDRVEDTGLFEHGATAGHPQV